MLPSLQPDSEQADRLYFSAMNMRLGEDCCVAVGNVNLTAGEVLSRQLGPDRGAADPRRAERGASESDARSNEGARPAFVLGAAAYQRVLATLETERGAGVRPQLLRETEGSYTGQRAQRAYQSAASDGEQESLARLFGVDVFV